jgi:hypothetical protein
VLVDFPIDRTGDAWRFVEDVCARHAVPLDIHDARTTRPCLRRAGKHQRACPVMTDARWIEVEDNLESACNHFDKPRPALARSGPMRRSR